MAIISQNDAFEESRANIIGKFTARHNVARHLRSVCREKTKGVSNARILTFLMTVAFTGKSIWRAVVDACRFSKDTVYRFMSSCTRWFDVLPMVAKSVIDKVIDPLTGRDRDDVLIIDDSSYERPRSRKVELLAKTFDHARQRFTRGFRMLSMGWSDGNSFVPVDFSLLSTGNDKTLLCGPRAFEDGSDALRNRQSSRRKATEVLQELLSKAKEKGIRARYVLFDSWFCLPSCVNNVHDLGYHVIGMVKRSSKVFFEFNGRMTNVKDIYRSQRKRRGLAHIRLSVMAKAYDAERGRSVDVKLVFVSKASNRKQWIVLLSTDTSIPDERVCQLYARRWQTECFYKVCKSTLRLAEGCQCRDYDSITTHTAIVFLQYMMLSEQERLNTDERSLGDLFYYVVDQMAEASFDESMKLILKALFDDISQSFHFSEEDRLELARIFISHLPQLFGHCGQLVA